VSAFILRPSGNCETESRTFIYSQEKPLSMFLVSKGLVSLIIAFLRSHQSNIVKGTPMKRKFEVDGSLSVEIVLVSQRVLADNNCAGTLVARMSPRMPSSSCRNLYTAQEISYATKIYIRLALNRTQQFGSNLINFVYRCACT
jgi:hypothetical protein